jgi:hypothetical protein
MGWFGYLYLSVDDNRSLASTAVKQPFPTERGR